MSVKMHRSWLANILLLVAVAVACGFAVSGDNPTKRASKMPGTYLLFVDHAQYSQLMLTGLSVTEIGGRRFLHGAVSTAMRDEMQDVFGERGLSPTDIYVPMESITSVMKLARDENEPDVSEEASETKL